MQEGIHPNYNDEAVVKCACGNTFVTGSVKSELKVDICSKCHPFFTGKQKNVDVSGRVDKFMKKFNLKSKYSYIFLCRRRILLLFFYVQKP